MQLRFNQTRIKIETVVVEPAKFIPTEDIIIKNKLMIAGAKYQKNLSYEDSKSYCETLEINGYKNWRIPTKDERFDWNKLFTKRLLIWAEDSELIEEWSKSKFLCVPVRDIS
jgi:hypothetical protein